jgi:hypothetical protein
LLRGGSFRFAGPEENLDTNGQTFMRTLIAIVVGLALSFGFVFAATHLGKGKAFGAILFVMLWLIFCGVDFANGVKAGYSAVDELGIHLIVFIVPAFGAWLSARFLA